MTENIYTMKLRARRHPVPEGLHMAVLTSERIGDLMAKDVAVVPRGGAVPSGAGIVVHAENARIADVTGRPDDAGSEGQGVGAAARS